MRPPDERLRVPLDLEPEREPLDFERDEPELFDREEPLDLAWEAVLRLVAVLLPPERDFFAVLPPERLFVALLPLARLLVAVLPPERLFFAALPLERDFVAALPLELEPPLGTVAGRSVGVAAGALAEATLVRPPGTFRSGSKPSSRRAIQAPIAIPVAAPAVSGAATIPR